MLRELSRVCLLQEGHSQSVMVSGGSPDEAGQHGVADWGEMSKGEARQERVQQEKVGANSCAVLMTAYLEKIIQNFPPDIVIIIIIVNNPS